MHTIIRRSVLIYFCVFFFLNNGTYSIAAVGDPSLAETKQLLQKSLTILQLDAEIARLTVQEGKVAEQIKQTLQQIKQQEGQVAETRNHAGKVLRAYYMGDRDQNWMLLLTAKSFSQAIAVVEYLNLMYQNDHLTLDKYVTSFKSLQNTQRKLETTQTDLKQVKNDFIIQRDRALALQKEVDDQIKLIPEEKAKVILVQMEELRNVWKDKVLPIFEAYFAGISLAMKKLPEILTGDSRDKYFKGLTFQISDKDLTGFFHLHNKELANLAFRFENGQFAAYGKEGDISASIVGRYTVEQTPNRLQFHVDKMTYNDNILDDTTNRAMEQQFDLSFSPEKYMPIIEATEVTTNDGLLTIKLRLKLK